MIGKQRRQAPGTPADDSLSRPAGGNAADEGEGLAIPDSRDALPPVGEEADGESKFPRPVRLAIIIGTPLGLWVGLYLVARKFF